MIKTRGTQLFDLNLPPGEPVSGIFCLPVVFLPLWPYFMVTSRLILFEAKVEHYATNSEADDIVRGNFLPSFSQKTAVTPKS